MGEERGKDSWGVFHPSQLMGDWGSCHVRPSCVYLLLLSLCSSPLAFFSSPASGLHFRTTTLDGGGKQHILRPRVCRTFRLGRNVVFFFFISVCVKMEAVKASAVVPPVDQGYFSVCVHCCRCVSMSRVDAEK